MLAALILLLATSSTIQGQAGQVRLPAAPSRLAQSSAETTITLQQGVNGYSGSQSTYIYQFAPDTNYCSSSAFKLGYKQQNAALVRFDLSSIPADAAITQASLQVYAAGWSGADISLGTYVVTRTNSLCQTTWNRSQSGSQWGLPGANDTNTDRRATAESSLATSGIRKWYTFSLTPAVQGWVAGTLSNNGVLLRQVVSSSNSLTFASSVAGDVSLRPKLVVTYRADAPASTPTSTEVIIASPTCTPTASATPTHTPTGAAIDTPTSTATPTASPTTASGQDTTVTLQQGANGYLGSQTTYIYQYSPDTNYCWTDQFRVGGKQQYAALARFDLSSIPADATITQASLQIYAAGWSGADVSLGAYVVTRTTSLCQTTWNRSQSGSLWGLPGANDTNTDRRATPESSLATSGIRKWYTLNLTPAVQGWVAGTLSNNGVLLRQTVSSSNSVSFASVAAGDVSLRPKLVVTYRADAPASTPTSTEVIVASPTCTPTASATPTHTPTGAAIDTPTSTATPTASPTTASGQDTTVTLQQGANGYLGSQTTYIYQYSPDTNNCWTEPLKVGYKQQNAALVRFDLSSIPADATITQASLQIYAAGWSGADVSLGAYVVTRTNSLCQTTWNRSQSGSLWGLPGANDTATDRRATPESSVATSGIHKWYSFNLTLAVQEWVGGTLSNNGVLLRQIVSSNYSMLFAGVAAGDVSLRPKLTLVYHVGGPEPTATPDGLIIGHITDAHIGAGALHSERLALAIQSINPRAQIMVDSGDCADGGTAGETQEYVQTVTVNAALPWKAVLGNHDTPSVFQSYVGPLQWSWDVGNYRLIGINTELIDYTALDLALTTQKRCILVGHFPLSSCTPSDQVMLRQRFITYHVPLYISGHTHVNSQTTDPETGTVLVTGQPAGGGSYRIITLLGNQVQNIDFQ